VVVKKSKKDNLLVGLSNFRAAFCISHVSECILKKKSAVTRPLNNPPWKKY
jgi:hypothetical protein